MDRVLREYWYAACAAKRLRSKPIAVRVLDLELAVFRDGSGRPHAVVDRCCHRGVRLSSGRVVDGNIQCPYHGWQYDGSGTCVVVPSLPEERQTPGGLGVGALPCIERDGYVWVWPGEGEPAPAPVIDGFDRQRWQQGCMSMGCSWLMGVENNLDWCHPGFSHPWSHPQFFRRRVRGLREQDFEVRVVPAGLVVFSPVTAGNDDPIPDRPAVTLAFELPNWVSVQFSRPMPLRIILQFVPTGAETCRLEWLRTKIAPVGPRVSWTNHEPLVFRQDRRLLESAQSSYTREGSTFERSVTADAPTLLARQIVDLAARREWAEKRRDLRPRRVVRVRA